MTLREEVLKNSGLLTEEVLEEGFFKKAALIATIIAGLAGAAIVGPKTAKEIKQYKNVKDVPVATRYEKAEAETNKDIANKEYLVGRMYDKMKFVEKIHADYNDRNNQAVIYIDMKKDSIHYPSLSINEIKNALTDYTNHLNEYSSKIEDKIGKTDFDRNPLKVVINVDKNDTGDFSEFISKSIKAVKDITGVDNSNVVFGKK